MIKKDSFDKLLHYSDHSFLLSYFPNNNKPEVTVLDKTKTYDSILALLLYDYKDEYDNPIIFSTRKYYYTFRYIRTSKMATEKYNRFQRNCGKTKKEKIAATLFASPLSAIDQEEINMALEAIIDIHPKMPLGDEMRALDLLKEAIYCITMNIPSDANGIWHNYKFDFGALSSRIASGNSPQFILSHAGFETRKVLLKDILGSVWLPYEEVSKKLPHPVNGPRDVPEVYYPYFD